ncbi:MAG: hypothetical protein Q7S22_07155 [Candidatus Micrarchaeota archaeon]|nr:hypothetical protein [Candidatus Micrarchaeota archaeon]
MVTRLLKVKNMLAHKFQSTKITPKGKSMIAACCQRIKDTKPELDLVKVERAASTIANMLLKENLGQLKMTEPEHLGPLIHVVNGHGDFRYAKITGLEYVARLLDGGIDLPTLICTNKYTHPWQIFAYMSMAGISPDSELPNFGRTLRALAISNTTIDIPTKHPNQELGHLLFAAAHLVPDKNMPFILNDRSVTLRELIILAIETHAEQENRRSTVCYDAHLTEGLCAATSLISGVEDLRGESQEFLNRQLFLLDVVATAIYYFRSIREYNLFDAIIKILHMPDDRTLPLMLVSHMLELAAFAELFGYTIQSREIINYVTNAFNQELDYHCEPGFLDFTLTHYRRAITLLKEIELARLAGMPLSAIDLATYTTNFDRPAKPIIDPAETVSKRDSGRTRIIELGGLKIALID